MAATNVKVRVKRKPKGNRAASAAGTDPNVLTFGQVAKLMLPVFGTEPVDAGRGQKLPAATVATAVAFAESDLRTNVYNGICCDGLLQVNRIHRTSEWAVKQFGRVLSAEEFGKQMQKANLNIFAGGVIFNAAGRKFGVDGGGGNPWEAFGNAKYYAALPKAVNATDAILKGLDPDALGVVNDITNVPGVLGFAGDAVSWIANEAAQQSAKWFLGAVAWTGKLFYREVVRPEWEHLQRMTVHYYNSMFGDDASYLQLMTTLGFWSLGYGILWRDADDLSHRSGMPERSALGQMVSKAQVAKSKAKLYDPKQAKKETPKKPKPKVSTAPVVELRKAQVERKRTVKVSYGKDEGVKLESETEDTERTPVDAS